MAEENKYPLDYERRFGGVAKLYTKAGAERLKNAHVCVVGLGGVGSWAAEALARTAVGRITLVDLDNVAESNTNRQLQAMTGVYGKPKVDATAERIHAINPLCDCRKIEDFIEVETAESLLPEDAIILDCIDNVKVKAAMAAVCQKKKAIHSCVRRGRWQDECHEHYSRGFSPNDRRSSFIPNALRPSQKIRVS